MACSYVSWTKFLIYREGDILKTLLLSSILVFFSVSASAKLCTEVLPGPASQVPKTMEWRADFSNPNQSGTFAKTSKAREEVLQEWVEMHYNTISSGATPGYWFKPELGVRSKVTRISDVDSRTLAKVELSNIPADGKIRLTLQLPVSGHTGMANARVWRTQDTFDVLLKGPDGNTVKIIDKGQSKDYTTFQEVELTLKPNETYTLIYDRHGSGGPGGFYVGRNIEIEWVQ